LPERFRYPNIGRHWQNSPSRCTRKMPVVRAHAIDHVLCCNPPLTGNQLKGAPAAAYLSDARSLEHPCSRIFGSRCQGETVAQRIDVERRWVEAAVEIALGSEKAPRLRRFQYLGCLAELAAQQRCQPSLTMRVRIEPGEQAS